MTNRLSALLHALHSLGFTAGGSSSASASIIHQSSRVLTHAQIVNWPSTPYAMIGAPASGRVAFPLMSMLTTSGIGAHPYGNVSADAYLSLHMASIGGGDIMDLCVNDVDNGLIQVTNLLTGAGGGIPGEDSIGANTVPFSNGPVPAIGIGTLLNVAPQSYFVTHAINLNLYNADGPLSLGDAGNTLSVGIMFVVFLMVEARLLTTVESGWTEATRTFS